MRYASLFLGLTLLGQEAPPAKGPGTKVPDSPYWVNYKRFTRPEGARSAHDDARARAEWMRERMGGDPPADFSLRVLEESRKAREAFPHQFQRPGTDLGLQDSAAAVSGNPAWTSLGPTNAQFTQNGVTLNKVDSGRLRTILPHPTDPNTVVVLTAGGGLWKTSNFGATSPAWTSLSDFVGSTSGGAAACGRSPNTLYLGLGDPLDGTGPDRVWSAGGAVLRSLDGGLTWSAPYAFADQTGTVNTIAVDTSLSQDIVLVGTGQGLQRSTDGGQTYGAVASIPGNHAVWSLVRTSAGWLAATRNMDSSDTANYLYGWLYLSTDRGATWTLTSDPVMATEPYGRFTLGIGQPGDATVYAFAGDRAGKATYDLYASQNGGLTWTKRNLLSKTPANPTNDQVDMDLMSYQAAYNQMVLVDPTDSSRNTLYLGGQLTMAKSTDGGSTWRLVSHWLPGGSNGGTAAAALPYVHADFHCAAFQTAGGANRALVGNDGGLFVSADGGQTWDDRKNSGLNSMLIFGLAVNPAIPGSALIGVQDNGTRIRVAQTGTFNQIKGGDGFGVGWAPASGISLQTYTHNTIRRSATNPPADQSNFTDFTSGLGAIGNSDGGASWYFCTPVYTPPASADPSGQVFFTYGNSGTGANSKTIWRSNASGWTLIGRSGTTPGLTGNGYVRSIPFGLGVSPLDLNRVAAAGAGGLVLLTTNGGASWTEANVGNQVPGWNNFNAGVAWANNNVLYVCSEAVATSTVRVARSSNGGTSWTGAGAGLPDVPVTRLAVDPGDASGNSVFAGTWIGVYRTTNGGISWAPFGTGLPQVRITDMYVAPDGSFLRIATYGRGLWEAATAATPAPVVTSFTPASGPVGTSVTVNGTGLAGATAVRFNGTVAAFTPVSDLALTATVPAGAGNGVISVTTPAGTGSSTDSFTVTVAPTIQVSVAPATPTLLTGAQLLLTATVTGTSNTAVTWSIASGGGSLSGSTATTTTYTAPATGGSAVITATSQANATRSGSATVTIKSRDLSGDGVTDVLDLATLARAWGATPASPNWNAAADLNGDGVIDDADLALFLAGF